MDPSLADLSPQALAEAFAGPPEQVARLLRAAAEGGAIEAQLLLGQVLLDGRGVAADPVAALGWFGRAAQAGNAEAMNIVGRCCANGWGTPPNAADAARWFRAAADRGSAWGLYNLATAMALGDGVERDLAGALGLFRRAADLGLVKAINYIGSFHEDGWAVPRDMAEAARCYALAAEGGDFRGMFNHARMLIDAGRTDEAQTWIDRLWPLATPPFRARVSEWLIRNGDIRDPPAPSMMR